MVKSQTAMKKLHISVLQTLKYRDLGNRDSTVSEYNNILEVFHKYLQSESIRCLRCKYSLQKATFSQILYPKQREINCKHISAFILSPSKYRTHFACSTVSNAGVKTKRNKYIPKLCLAHQCWCCRSLFRSVFSIVGCKMLWSQLYVKSPTSLF